MPLRTARPRSSVAYADCERFYLRSCGDPFPEVLIAEADLAEAGYSIAVTEDAALGSQPFDALTPEQRPQDPYGDGRGWTFRLGEHGGDGMDDMPETIRATDAQGRWAVYVPLTLGGKIVVPRRHSGD